MFNPIINWRSVGVCAHGVFWAQNGRGFHIKLRLLSAAYCPPCKIPRVSLGAAEFPYDDLKTASKSDLASMARIIPTEIGLSQALKKWQKAPLVLAIPRGMARFFCAGPRAIGLKIFCSDARVSSKAIQTENFRSDHPQYPRRIKVALKRMQLFAIVFRHGFNGADPCHGCHVSF